MVSPNLSPLTFGVCSLCPFVNHTGYAFPKQELPVTQADFMEKSFQEVIWHRSIHWIQECRFLSQSRMGLCGPSFQARQDVWGIRHPCFVFNSIRSFVLMEALVTRSGMSGGKDILNTRDLCDIAPLLAKKILEAIKQEYNITLAQGKWVKTVHLAGVRSTKRK